MNARKQSKAIVHNDSSADFNRKSVSDRNKHCSIMNDDYHRTLLCFHIPVFKNRNIWLDDDDSIKVHDSRRF